MALQNGTVDAQDNAWFNAVASGAGEVQKYMIPTGHMSPSMATVMNKAKFDALPDEYKALIREISKDINRMDFEISIKKQDGYFKQLQDEYHLDVCEVSDEFRQAMKDAAAEAVESAHKQVNNEPLYAALEKCLNN